MDRYKMVVLSSALEGRDDEFNHWYDTQHIHDVLNVPGFYRAQRLELENPFSPDLPSNKYMAIYEFETDDLKKTFDYFVSIANTDKMQLCPANDSAKAVMHIARVSGSVVEKDAPTPWPE